MPNDTSTLLQQEVDKGFVIGPWTAPPFPITRINPLGVVQSKYSLKKRLIVDLSAPHNLTHCHSINDLIDKDDYSLTYVKVDDAIRIIKTMRSNCGEHPIYLCKTDMADAFKQIPIHTTMVPFHGVKWKDSYYFYTRLVFGSRSSPKIFDTLASVVCWILENNYSVSPLLHLLDDFLGICPPNRDPQRFMNTMIQVFNNLGIPLSAKKTIGPVETVEYLGIEISTKEMVARLPQAKLTRIRQFVRTFLTLKKCKKQQLLSLLGHLQFACRVIPVGRSFTARLLKASTTVNNLAFYVYLNIECRKDLLMWDKLLTDWNGVSLFLDLATTDTADMELFTDASGIGFGGYYQGEWFAGPWPDNLTQSLDSELSIAFQELYPIVVAAVLFGRQWRRKQILFYCDNMATVFAINKARSHSPAMMQLMRRLAIVSATCNFAFKPPS